MKLKKLSKSIRKTGTKRSISKKAGLPPGSLIYTGRETEIPVNLELIQYNADRFSVNKFTNLDSLVKQINPDYVNWIHVNNLTNTTFIEEIGNYFNIHTLTLEDVLNIEHLPKIEVSEDQLFLTLKFIRFSDDGELIDSHISLILGSHCLLSFADTEQDIFAFIKNRLESVKNRARLKKTGYLFYLLLDNLVDNYYLILDEIYNKLEKTEIELMEYPNRNRINEIHQIKNDLIIIRKSLLPLEKAVSSILKDEFDLINDADEIFFRDVYDHIIQLVQTHDSYHDFISSLIELNSSNMNNSLNQTIKILTIITTIFIPLTFIAGIYGMNFKNIPELEWEYGYFFALGLIILIGVTMIFFMKKKGFL